MKKFIPDTLVLLMVIVFALSQAYTLNEASKMTDRINKLQIQHLTDSCEKAEYMRAADTLVYWYNHKYFFDTTQIIKTKNTWTRIK